MSSKLTPGAYGELELAYNVRSSKKTASIVDLIHRGKKIVACSIGKLPMGEDNVEAVNKALEEAKKWIGHHGMQSQTGTGLYWETETFRFLRSDPLNDEGRMYYTGQGYVPNLLVQIKVDVNWCDLTLTVA